MGRIGATLDERRARVNVARVRAESPETQEGRALPVASLRSGCPRPFECFN
jgi:hypothetical protein